MKKLKDIIVTKNFYHRDTVEQSCCLHDDTSSDTEITDILEKYDIDDVEEININNYNLTDRYNYWNREIFGMELPKLKEIAFRALGKNASGKATIGGILQKGNQEVVEVVNWTSILLSKNIKYTQKILDVILIHEMIHVYYLSVQKMNINHGKPFQNKAMEIGNRVGFTIPLTDNITEFKAHEESLQNVTIIILEFPNTTAVCFYPMKKFEEATVMVVNYFKDYLEEYKHSQVKMTCGIGKHGLTQKYPIQRNFTDIKLKKITTDQIREIRWKNGTVTEKWLDEA